MRFHSPASLPNPTASARLLCDAGGGLGHWLVLPVAGMAVEIYNLRYDLQQTYTNSQRTRVEELVRVRFKLVVHYFQSV
jgi:hypothetical protein